MRIVIRNSKWTSPSHAPCSRIYWSISSERQKPCPRLRTRSQNLKKIRSIIILIKYFTKAHQDWCPRLSPWRPGCPCRRSPLTTYWWRHPRAESRRHHCAAERGCRAWRGCEAIIRSIRSMCPQYLSEVGLNDDTEGRSRTWIFLRICFSLLVHSIFVGSLSSSSATPALPLATFLLIDA